MNSRVYFIGAERRQKVAHGGSRGYHAVNISSPGGAEEWSYESALHRVCLAKAFCRPFQCLFDFVFLTQGHRRGLTSIAVPQLMPAG